LAEEYRRWVSDSPAIQKSFMQTRWRAERDSYVARQTFWIAVPVTSERTLLYSECVELQQCVISILHCETHSHETELFLTSTTSLLTYNDFQFLIMWSKTASHAL